MSLAIQNRFYDGNASFEGGMDSSRFPNLIPINSFATGLNVVCRNSSVSTRSGWSELTLTADSVTNTDIAQFLNYGFQGGTAYLKTTGKTVLVCVVKGKIYEIDLDTNVVSQKYPIGPSTATTRSTTARNYFCQAGRYLIIQDGLSKPLIYNSSSIIEAGESSTDVPKGTVMAYGQGRLFVLVNDSEIKAGDLIYGGRAVKFPIVASGIGPAHPNVASDHSLNIYVETSGFSSIPAQIGTSSSTGAPILVEGHSFIGLGADIGVNNSYDEIFKLNAMEASDSPFGDTTASSTIKKFTLKKISYESLVRQSNPSLYGTVVTPATTNVATVPTNLKGSGGYVTFILSGQESDVLNFQEDDYLATGGVLASPTQMGKIQNLAFPTIADTTAGQGDLLAFCDNGVCSFAVSQPRSSWKKLNSFQRVTLADIGCLGDRTVTNVNGDIFFRSHDGVRSYRNASATQGTPGQNSISAELRTFLNADSTKQATEASGIYFDSRYLLAAWGKPNYIGSQTVYSSILSLDFGPVQRNNRANVVSPAYDGAWTGLNFYQLIRGVFSQKERAFGFVDNFGVLSLYELRPDRFYDSSLGVTTPIRAVVETRSFEFEKPYTLKKLSRADLWVSNLQGQVDFKVYFRPDKFPCWIEWTNFQKNAQMNYCPTTPEEFLSKIPTSLPQFRPQIRLTTPPDTVDPSTNRLFRMGYEFQLRIEWVGCASLDKVLIHADDVVEPINGEF
jgi:hypothetical protein